MASQHTRHKEREGNGGKAARMEEGSKSKDSDERKRWEASKDKEQIRTVRITVHSTEP
jgi:hypothetical protein